MSAGPEPISGAMRVPPQSVEAEQSVLGGLLRDSGAWDRLGDLRESDFYGFRHRAIFAAMAAMLSANKPVDVITVHDQLQGLAEECGGLAYLNALAESVPSAANIRRYAEIVRERAEARRLIAAADTAAEQSWRVDIPLDDRRDAVFAAIHAADGVQQAATLALPELVAQRLRRYEDAASGTLVSGWPTKIPTLDKALLGGLEPARLYVIAARPAVGKSSLAAALSLRMAHDGHPVLFASLEMTAGEVADRMLSNMSSLPYADIRRGSLHPADCPALTDAGKRLADLPLTIEDRCVTINDLTMRARRIRGLQVLVVDYLQLLHGASERRQASRNAEIEEISRRLKRFAVDAGVIVIALSQLNREVEARADGRPRLSDLRDSGAIEQDADTVILLWQARELSADKGLIGCELAKNRQGATTALALDFTKTMHLWRESTEALRQRGDAARL